MRIVPGGRAGYSLIQLIGAVVIGGILLAIVTPAVAHAVRVRQAEAVLKHDLHNAATLYEMAYLGDRRYPDHSALQPHLSPGIAVDSQAVSGERVYLRLRHVPTGQRCVLDYSPSSAVARNRADCFGGGQARDTALAVTPEPPDAPGADTFGIGPPTPPDTADNELALLSPSVDNPTAQSGAPGATMTQTFMVTNRSPTARTFRFEVGSSSPAVVGTPSSPTDLTLAPGTPTGVRVTYSVAAGAVADASSVIPLRAVDNGDERWSATGSFTFSTALALAAPGVAVNGADTRTETAGTEFDVSWTVTNRSNAARGLQLSLAPGDPAHVEVVSLSMQGRVPFAPGQTRIVSARLRLAPGSDGGTRSAATLQAEDAEAAGYRAAAGVALETATVLADPSVGAPAGRTADPGTPFTLSWTVRNESNTPRSFQITPSLDDPTHVELLGSSGTGTETIGRGQALAVTVTYLVKSGSVAGRASDVRLHAVDRAATVHEASGSVQVATNTVLAAPAITPPGAQSARPGEDVLVTWTVRNASNADRVLEIDASSTGPELSLVSAAGAGAVTFAAFEARSVSARYRVRDGSPAGAPAAPSLVATDRAAPAHAAQASFDFSTAADVRPPSLTAPADRAADPGTTTTGAFRLVNRSNLPRTYALVATSSDGSVVSDPADPAQVSVGAFAGVDIQVSTVVASGALGYARAGVALSAVDAEAGENTAAAQFAVGVNAVYRTPSVTWQASRVLRPGTGAVDSAMVVNRSNVPAELCFTLDAGAGNVAGGLVAGADVQAPACRTAGAAGTAGAALRIPVAYSAHADALAGWTNVLALTAFQMGAESLASSAWLMVEADLVVLSPQWVRLPGSPLSWDVGDERELGYTLRNRSNAPRSFCVGIASVDGAKLAPVGASPICGLRVGARDTVRVGHSLRAAGAGTGLRVDAVVHDEESSVDRAEGGFYNVIRETRPTAVWDAPSPVYVRKWATFDGSRSWSPVGSPIVRYVWTWGLFMHQWDAAEGRFVYTGLWETARDEVGVPAVDRAYDLQGTFSVCLTAVDAAGRASEPNCHPVTTMRPTLARLAWRYRGWWTNQDWCLDVWWDNQCNAEHGNARWEIDLGPSVGDVPIRAAYAVVRVKLHNTDDPDRPATVTYAGTSGTTPGWGSYTFGSDFPNAVARAQDGRWRVLTTAGTSAFGWPSSPNLANHPLVLNINLAKATGAFDGGPHWVPDDAWITLHVQDAYERWTSVSAYRNHDKGQWRAAYDTTVTGEAVPTATVSISSAGEGAYVASGAGDSPGGRIVDSWWEITYEDLVQGSASSWTTRGATVDLEPSPCERITATFVVKDDEGKVGRGSDSVSGSGGSRCSDPGGEIPR